MRNQQNINIFICIKSQKRPRSKRPQTYTFKCKKFNIKYRKKRQKPRRHLQLTTKSSEIERYKIHQLSCRCQYFRVNRNRKPIESESEGVYIQIYL